MWGGSAGYSYYVSFSGFSDCVQGTFGADVGDVQGTFETCFFGKANLVLD